jgi:hypothetical protein
LPGYPGLRMTPEDAVRTSFAGHWAEERGTSKGLLQQN